MASSPCSPRWALCLLLACSAPPAPPRGFSAAASCPFTGASYGAVVDGSDVVLSLFEVDALERLRLSDCTELRRWSVTPGPRALTRLGGGFASASASALDVRSPDGGALSLPTPLAANALIGADLDADGAEELIATLGATAAEARVAVYGVSGAALSPRQELPVSGASALAAADLDGDSDLDVVVARATDGRLTVLNGVAGALAPADELTVCAEPFAVTTARLGADALPSIVVTCRTGGLELLRPGAGGYQHHTVARDGTLYDTAVADFDADGQLDFASVDPFGHQLVVWWGKAPGELEAAVEVTTARGPILLRTLQFDTDARPELLVHALSDRSVTVFRTEGTSR